MYIEIMKNEKYKFPMGTKEVAEIKGCYLRTVQFWCEKLNIPRAGNTFVIMDQETLDRILDSINDHSGRPPVDKE